MMKNYILKIAAVACFICSSHTAFSQTQFYFENMNSGAPASLNGSGDWVLDDFVLPQSNGYTSASAGYYFAGTNQSGTTETLTLNGVSTLAFTNLTVQWGAYKDPGFPGPVTFEWSSDGVVWNAVTYTDVAANSTWGLVGPISLPAAAAGQYNLQLRWIYSSNIQPEYFALDDISISGNIVQYFSKSTGNLELTTSWGTNPDGTGIMPPNFTVGTKTYNIVNNPAPTIGANWTVSGANSKIAVGSPTFGANFTIPLSATYTGSMDINSTSTVTIVNTNSSTFTFAVISNGSTVEYAASGPQTIKTFSNYRNLRISGSGNKTYSGTVIVQENLDIATGSGFTIANSGFTPLTLNGTVSGGGLFVGSSAGRININGSGPLGTLTFSSGAQMLGILTINRSSTGLITLGSNLTINSNFQFTNGSLNLNGNNLTLNSNSLTFPAAVSNGMFRGSATSSLIVNGTGVTTANIFMDQTSATTRALGTFSLNRAGSTLTLGNALDIYESVTPSSGTINSAGFITLKSSSSAKARVGMVGLLGGYSGNTTVELFKPAGVTGWTLLNSGGVNGNTFANWNSSFAITCASCPNGSVVGGTPFTSVYWYDETQGAGNAANAAHYIELPSTAVAINSYTGYWVYLGNGYPNTSAMTIPLTGPVNTKNSNGNITLTLTGGVSTENGWNLIANPYPSPILVSQVIAAAGASNVDNALLVYDPDTDANVVYSSSSSNSVIPMGQSFMIRALVNPVTLIPDENWKTTTNSNAEILKSSAPQYIFNDFLLDLTSNSVNKSFSTQAYFDFSNGSSTSFDNGRDALSLASSIDPGTPRIISISNGIEYVRNSLASLSGVVSIPVKVSTGYTGVYSISPVNINMLPAGACVALYDIANNITHDLKTGAYTTTIAANASSHQFELKITMNPGSLTSNVNSPVCAMDNTGSIIAQGTSAGPWNYIWKNASNTIIKTSNNKASADTLKNIAQGIYKVDVNTVGSCDNAGSTFTVQATIAQPSALFSANTSTVYENSNVPVSFTNNSSNAVSYAWNFGDGSPVVTTQHASHVFNDLGVYNVSLTVKNGACGDSSVFVSPIQVMQLVGLEDNSGLTEESFFVSKDQEGAFVQLNFAEFTEADVYITNVLGQQISRQIIGGKASKTYLNVPEQEKVLFITVIANNKKQTKKLIN